MRLRNLDTMQTAAASSSWLTLDENKAVQLGEQTGLRVDRQALGFALTLLKGEITAQIEKPLDSDESFTVHAGNITLGVRGTVFTVRFGADMVVTVSVEKGVVAVMDASGNEIDELREGDTRSYNAETTEPVMMGTPDISDSAEHIQS
jgi:ferric-dicitrate binding protein FerR (iron transport regulator)